MKASLTWYKDTNIVVYPVVLINSEGTFLFVVYIINIIFYFSSLVKISTLYIIKIQGRKNIRKITGTGHLAGSQFILL